MVQVSEDGEYLDAPWHHRHGLQALARARWGYDQRSASAPDIVDLYKEAISHLVESFLIDRMGYANCFAWAHRAGAELEARFGCEWALSDDGTEYSSQCPIFGLHSICGTSVGWVLNKRCSVCDAPPMTCRHVPGRTYEGAVCELVYSGFERFDHLALTANPDFSYTWHWPKTAPVNELLEDGTITAVGDRVPCTHCRSCYGYAGPSSEDLDPVARWNRLRREHDQSIP